MKRILVGLDGSPRERQVLDTAIAQASRFDAKLVLFHAVSLPVGLPPRALAVPPDAVAAMLVEASRARMDELARTVPSGLVDRVQVEIGVPWRAICEIAKADDCDLIVVGSHGYGGIDRLLGTTAAKIVNHAPCSVLIERARS